MKKASSLVALLAAAACALCTACGDSSKTDASSSQSSVSQTETTSQTTTTTTTKAQTTTTTAPAQTTTTATTPAAPKRPAKYKALTLSGNSKDRTVTTDFCYIESDKYILLFEKDLSIPGDFKKNIDAIIDKLEQETGLSYCPDSFDTTHLDFSTPYYGFDPWEDMDFGKKIPIQFTVDRKDEGYSSCACAEFAQFDLYYLYTDEVWNSVPSFKDNTDWRRENYVDYTTIAHELTHVLTERCLTLPKIMTEGSAVYFSRKVVGQLTSLSPDMKTALTNEDLLQYALPEPITAANAEKVFYSDYAEIDVANRGAEYRLGCEFCKYLEQNYGKDFYAKYVKAAMADPVLKESYRPEEGMDKAAVQKHIDTLKSLFGNDVFTKFGANYQKYV